MLVQEAFYRETRAGGFTRVDGTVQFYTRVNALLAPEMTVVDLGAGRGLASEVKTPFVQNLVTIRGKVARVIGLDIDKAVLENPIVDEAVVFDGVRMPLGDETADLIFSDNVLEHIADPATFSADVARVLKPGGWFCARTPYLYSALVVASSLVPNSLHSRVLRRVQPGRQARDVFPTVYKLNTKRALEKWFPKDTWEHFSYTWSPEPAYHFNNKILFAFFLIYQYLKTPFSGEFLLVFIRKKTWPR